MLSGSSRFHNPYFSSTPTPRSWWQQDRWAYCGSAVVLCIVLWYVLTQQRWLWIDYITVVGNQYLTVEEVAEATRQALLERRWYVFPQRLVIFTDRQALTNSIELRLTERLAIEQLTVTTDFPDTVIVTINERVPGYVYILNSTYYYLDDVGIITAQVQPDRLDPHFPRIRDNNSQRQVGLNDAVVKQDVIVFIEALDERFTAETGLNIAEYSLAETTCQAKEFVAEKIFADEIASSTDVTVKSEKKAILERLQNSEISVDQSLDLLEDVKRTEQTVANDNEAFVHWEATYVAAPCNYVAVLQDVTVVTQEGLAVYFDSARDLAEQLAAVKTLLQNTTSDQAALSYIDVRFTDRAYYQ